MKAAIAFVLIGLCLSTAGAKEPDLSASPTPALSPSPQQGLSDFPLSAPGASASSTPLSSAAPPFHLSDSWARLVGKSFSDLMLEATRAFDAGDYDRAIDINSFALTQNLSKPQASVAAMNRGNAYAAKGDYERAIRDVNESVTLNPANAGGYVDRALILRKQGDSGGALKDYAEAIRIDPKQWQAYFNRAHDEAEDEDFNAAVRDLDKVIEIRPQFGLAFVIRAAVLLAKGEIDKAIADGNRAIQLDPNLPDAYLTRARAYAAKHDYAAAEKDVTAAKESTAPRAELVSNGLAWLRATSPDAKLRNGQEAVKLAQQSCELTQWKRWQCIDTLAAAYAEAGDFEQAKKYARQALNADMSVHDRNKAEERLRLYEQGKPFRDILGL